MRLKDKVAIVTGGSQGIGAAIAKRFAAEGAKVAIVSRSLGQRAQDLLADVASSDGTARHVAADITGTGACDDVAAAVLDAFGTIDILVNNAGVFTPCPVEETTEAVWDAQLDLNLKSCFFMARAVLPTMKAQQAGKIVNIASIAGVGGFPNSAAYCASKGGLINMTRALALELAPHGINVNALSPGNIITPLNEELRADAAWAAKCADLTPNGEAFLPAEDMAGTAVYLASDDARTVHGANIMVDGGWSAW